MKIQILVMALLWTMPTASDTNQPTKPLVRVPRHTKSDMSAKRDMKPVEVRSESWELMPDKKSALWKGNVLVVRDDMKVRCDVLRADYDDFQRVRIKKFTCKGNVHMQQAAAQGREEREIWGEVAIFDNDNAELTVTGSPQAREGNNTMRGEKITYMNRTERLEVDKPVFHIETPAKKDSSTRSSPGLAPVLTKEKK